MKIYKIYVYSFGSLTLLKGSSRILGRTKAIYKDKDTCFQVLNKLLQYNNSDQLVVIEYWRDFELNYHGEAMPVDKSRIIHVT